MAGRREEQEELLVINAILYENSIIKFLNICGTFVIMPRIKKAVYNVTYIWGI